MPLLPIPNLTGMSSLSQGIRYGDLTFSEPRAFPPVLMAPFQGIYAVVAPDPAFKPRPFRLLYIGETADLSKRLTDQHEKYSHWKREANGQTLYCAYYMTTMWTEQQRKDTEAALIKQYDPPCNTLLRSLFAPPVPPLKRLW